MIPLLPPLHPDELLYSFLARVHWLSCSDSPKQTLSILFGARGVRAGVALQAHIGALSEQLPAHRGLTPERIALETTLFPYLAAFQSPAVKAWALATLIKGNAGGVHVRLGLVASAVRLPAILCYCPACREEMLRRLGELYWKRVHQLPGVLVCPDHHVPLRASSIVPAALNQHEFVAADVSNCPDMIDWPEWSTNPDVMRLLSDIANASYQVLAAPPSARSLSEWSEQYRSELFARGFGRGQSHIQQAALHNAYLDHFHPILSQLPEVAPEPWLSALVRKPRKVSAPLHHILLGLLLKELSRSPCHFSFGCGPWLCRNPLADHYGQAVIKDCDTHTEKGKIIGVFHCPCGYVFSTVNHETKRVCILSFGPLFESRLRELVASGTGLRAAARALSVDTNTVRRYVTLFGLDSPWKVYVRKTKAASPDRDWYRYQWSMTCRDNPEMSRSALRSVLPREYAWLYRNDRVWLMAQPPHPENSHGGQSRRDWNVIDSDLADRIRRDALQLLKKKPPVSITRAELERGLGTPQWLESRLKKLPLCAAALRDLEEPLDDFRHRRILWAAEELRKRGKPTVIWRLRRLAGLPARCSNAVEAALKGIEEIGA